MPASVLIAPPAPASGRRGWSDWIARHVLRTRLRGRPPRSGVELVAQKAYRFWRPFVGPYENNWSHPFDVRRVLPDAATGASWFHAADVVATGAWMLGALALFTLGAVTAWRRAAKPASLALLVIAWLFLTHLVTFADPRFRIPVLPLIVLFQALGAVVVVRRVWPIAARAISRSSAVSR
jgi:hypothetical protein